MKSRNQTSLALFVVALLTIFARPGLAADADADAKVLAKVHFDNQQEIQVGKLAQTKDASSAVKAYADMLVKQHTAMDTELREMARQKGVSLDRFVPDSEAQKIAMERDQKELQLLSRLSGNEFNRELAYSQQLCHAALIAYLRTMRPSLKDAAIVNYVDRLLPIIQAHLDQARRLAASLAE